MINLKHEEFVRIMQESFYELFSIPYERLEWLFYKEPSLLENKIKRPYEPKVTRKNKNKDYTIRYDEFAAVRDMGDCSMYSAVIVPIHFYTHEMRRGKETTINVRYIGHSTDDESQGFWKECNTSEEVYDMYKKIFIYLEQHPHMEDNESFIKYWKVYGVDTFDFN